MIKELINELYPCCGCGQCLTKDEFYQRIKKIIIEEINKYFPLKSYKKFGVIGLTLEQKSKLLDSLIGDKK